MKRAIVPAALLLAACTTTTERPRTELLFSGGHRDWTVEVRERQVTLRERVGGKRWTYEDLAPDAEPMAGGVRYRGVLRREYVIARMVEADELDYTLDIAAAGCLPGAPATITLRTRVAGEPVLRRGTCGRAGGR